MHLSQVLHLNKDDYLLSPKSEKPWVELQPYLLGRGYRLRPRYDPDWTPSWFVQPGKTPRSPKEYEDSHHTGYSLLDAVRISDGQKVVFKRVKTGKDELGIATYLSSEENRRDPRNHTVPILDVIMIPGTDEEALLVMPFLMESHLLPFRFLGEFCEYVLQMLETLEFMHEHNIAHRDACRGNLMMDTTKVVPKGHHFCRWNSHDGVRTSNFQWNTRRSVGPVSYYIIDFGLSTRCDSKDDLVVGIFAQDKTVPELSTEIPYNPFMVDVYQIGNVIKRFIKEYQGLEAFIDLADAMTQSNARDRPTMSKSVEMCKAVNAHIITSRSLESRIWRQKTKMGYQVSRIEKLAVILGWNPIDL